MFIPFQQNYVLFHCYIPSSNYTLKSKNLKVTAFFHPFFNLLSYKAFRKISKIHSLEKEQSSCEIYPKKQTSFYLPDGPWITRSLNFEKTHESCCTLYYLESNTFWADAKPQPFCWTRIFLRYNTNALFQTVFERFTQKIFQNSKKFFQAESRASAAQL